MLLIVENEQGSAPTEQSINKIQEEKKKMDLQQYVLKEYSNILAPAMRMTPGYSS